MDLSRDRWAGLTAAERRKTATALAKDLPAGFAFDAVRVCRLGAAKTAVAFFRHGDATFALVPGGPTTVGFDARPWVPTPREQKSWGETAEEYELTWSIQQYIAKVTRRPKTVVVPPLLVETVATEIGWTPAPLDDPDVRKVVRREKSPHVTLTYKGGAQLRVQRFGRRVVAERYAPCTHTQVVATLRADGFRLPTSDEWEHLCGGGADTLFRWGDHLPPRAATGCDARPNGFGLTIAANPYFFELTADAAITRGGDGGSAACGGAGLFAVWMPMATAYFDRDSCRRDPREPIAAGYTVGRRVLELG